MSRPIPKLPTAPTLNIRTIKLLTKLCFKDDKIEPNINIDTVFIFGTSISLDRAAKAGLELIKTHNVSKLILTGGQPNYSDSRKVDKPEAELLLDIIQKELPNKIEICIEKESWNSMQNIIFSKQYLTHSKNIALVGKNFSMGRQYLTFLQYFKDKNIYAKPFTPVYEDTPFNIDASTWHKSELYIRRVWGEFLRIKFYGESGHLNLQPVQKLIDCIT